GELHQQVVELVDESQRAVAYLPPFRIGKTVSGSAEHVDRSRSRVVEAPEQVQERALARAGGADDGDYFPLLDFQRYRLEHVHGFSSLAESLAQVATGEPLTAPCTMKTFMIPPWLAPSVRRMAMSGCLSVTAITSVDTMLNAATATIRSRMMNIMVFSICTARK